MFVVFGVKKWMICLQIESYRYVVMLFYFRKKKKLGKFVLFRLGNLQIYGMFKRICGNINLYKYVEYIFLLYFINFKKINFYFIYLGLYKKYIKRK